MAKRNLYYVVSSHWDREWYETFQNFRYKLVDMFDEILAAIDSGELKGPFHADGQACMLEDYLEARPEKKDIITKKLSEDMISAGPWYNLPDEFLISGEAMLRNFRLGHKIVKELGGSVSKAGYLSDMFGHISQMPQIFKGFGIKAAFVWRGTDREQRNIIWQGADGTKIPTYVFSPYGYGEYSIFVRLVDKDFYSDFDEKGFPQRVEKFVKQECDANSIEPVLIFDGVDLLCWDKAAYKAFFDYFKNDERYNVKHVHLDEYMKKMLADYAGVTKTLKGELTKVATDFINDNTHWLYGTISARADIKQENTICQNLLSCWAEPLAIYANLLTGAEYPQTFLDIAWKWLMKNHPHDSICGCSIDEVHKDMWFRFSQAKQIAQKLTQESLKKIAASVDVKFDDDQIRLTVFNPLQSDIDEVVNIGVQFPHDWPYYFEFLGFEHLPAFRIYDTGGNEINYQKLTLTPNVKSVHTFRTKVPHVYDATQLDIALRLKIPAIGYQTLIIKKARQAEPVRHPDDFKLAHSGNTLENNFIRASVESNGTITLFDKKTEQTYKGLMAFEENADIGNGWFCGLAVNDEIISSQVGKSQVSIVHNGPELAALKIRTVLSLPEKFDFAAKIRSKTLKDFVIESKITLRKNSDCLEVETVIDNNIRDHRLRVVFPTQADTSTYFADSPFDVVERNIKLPKDNYIKKELETDTKPQQSWTAVCDEKRGLAVVSPGQYETAAADEPQKPIKLTLFRSFEKTVMTSGQTDCQLLKKMTFKYNIIPIAANFDRQRLFTEAAKIANGFKAVQFLPRDIISIRPTEKLVPSDSFVSLAGAVLTGICRYNGNIEIRFFNPSDNNCTAIVKLGTAQLKNKFTKAFKTDFLGNKITDIYLLNNGKFSINLKPKEITTLVIE